MKRTPTKPGAERRQFQPDRIHTFAVDTDGTGLLDFLLAAMPDQKRTSVKAFLAHRQVMVNGQVTTQFDTELHAGDTVKVNFSRSFVEFRNPRLHIVYEDDDILVVNKGYGLLSIGTDSKRDGTAYSILRDYLKSKDPRNKIFVIHRLDQHTSGLMMFAKTIEAKEAMQHNWNNMVLARTYVAVVEGTPEPQEGVIRSYLAENSEHQVYSVDDPAKGQLAVTQYRTLRSRGNYSLVELNLSTGRKNQIRVHMAEKGHPIVGDRRYGAKTSPIRRLALHARTLKFAHPITRRAMDFSTPIPAAFQSIVR